MMSWVTASMSAILICIGLAAGAVACPNVTEGKLSFKHSAADLYQLKSYQVVAGGETDLINCEGGGDGYVVDNPDISISYESSPGYDLEVRTKGSCDTVLLINDDDEEWIFDDDAGDGSNALLHIADADSGRYDIWVGTYSSANCDTELILETF